MSKNLFGTDGVRGLANDDLTPELALSLGRAAGAYVRTSSELCLLLLGKDTRRSSDMLESAFAAGFCSSGGDVHLAGIIPTGTLALFVKEGPFALGAMVSASHNPAPDNGIKLIGPNGRKLPDDVERDIESLVIQSTSPRAMPAEIGKISVTTGLLERHIEWAKSRFPTPLDGLRILVDCAHGAATHWAKPVLEALGARVMLVGASPNGDNINAEGGATKPAAMQRATLEAQADVGLAFDGDADRVVFSDERGRLVNGDQLLALWSVYRKACGDFDPPVVVGTVMSNMGLERYLSDHGITLERAPVGDRYVVERMDATGALIGGEQSGHLVFRHLGPTGDGLLTAAEILQILARMGKPLSELAHAYEPWPQLLVNIQVTDRTAWLTENVASRLEKLQSELGDNGRLLVRASGTQPMVRVMCEHMDREKRDALVSSVLDTLISEAGGRIYSQVELTDALGD